MRILIIGEESHLQEAQLKFGQHDYTLTLNHNDAQKLLEKADVVFDFVIDDEPEFFGMYNRPDLIVFLNTVKISLTELKTTVIEKPKSVIFGFNGLPTLLNRAVLEVSLFEKSDEHLLLKICEQLKTEIEIVDDRVGLVTPRIICMIINEAYFTEQEGTATRADIDLAMKLGTNYPYGPFEWCSKIGLHHVYETLEAVYEDTRDERYKICPALKKEYLRS